MQPLAGSRRRGEMQTKKTKSAAALLNDPMTNLLVDHNADGALGHIPDNTSASVVELVRHTLVHSAVHLDVHIITDLVVAQIRGQVDISFVPERA
jgi:hypothetical protein